MPRILFVTYGGGHAKMLIPVIHDLRARGSAEIVVLGATSAGPELRGAGIEGVGYVDLVGPADTTALAHGRRLLGDSHDPRLGIPIEESTAYLGLSYQDLVDRLGAEEAAARYARYRRHAFLPLGPMRRAIERWRPDVVVATTSPKSERAALLVAREKGIPTVRLEDLFALRPTIFPSFVPDVVADVVCVGSTIARDNAIASGVPADHVRLTGNPAFDRLARVDPAQGRALRDEIGAAGSFLVLLTAGEDEDLALAELADIVERAVPDGRLAVRRHPNFRHATSDQYLASVRGRVVLLDDQPLDAVLGAADAVISVTSTTCVESVRRGRPVIQLGPGTGIYDPALLKIDDLPLYEYGASLRVDHREALAAALARVAVEGRALAARAATVFVPPGDAARRVADEIVAVAPSYSRA